MLATRRAIIPAKPTAPADIRVFGAKLAPCQAGECADVDFQQSAVTDKILIAKDDLCSLLRAPGGAGITRHAAQRADQPRLPAGLRLSQFGQGRIKMTLHPPLSVPDRLTMTHQ